MMRVGVDANCFKQFCDELIEETIGEATTSVNRIFDLGHIPLDQEEFIIQEWRDCTGAHAKEFIEDWITNRLIEDKIRYYPEKACRQCVDDLRKKGVPPRDRKILSFMKNIAADYFLSKDIDCYEPTLKKAASHTRSQIISRRSGSICKHMEKQYRVKVMDFENWLACVG